MTRDSAQWLQWPPIGWAASGVIKLWSGKKRLDFSSGCCTGQGMLKSNHYVTLIFTLSEYLRHLLKKYQTTSH